MISVELIKFFVVIVKLAALIFKLVLKLPPVVTVKLSKSKKRELLPKEPSAVRAKFLKLNPLKLVAEELKSSVSIRFKLSDETVPVLAISLAKFVTSIVTVSASIDTLLVKSSPAIILRLSAFIVVLLIKSAPVWIFKTSTLATSNVLPSTVISAAAIVLNVFVPAS